MTAIIVDTVSCISENNFLRSGDKYPKPAVPWIVQSLYFPCLHEQALSGGSNVKTIAFTRAFFICRPEWTIFEPFYSGSQAFSLIYSTFMIEVHDTFKQQ